MRMTRRFLGAATAALLAATPAAAEIALFPVPTGAETARFLRGTPTLTLETARGGVEVTPLPTDHGHLSFAVAVYNRGGLPANFGIENVAADVGGATIPILSERELEKRARSRALWTQVGVTLLSGVAAGIASTAHDTSHARGRIATPGGTYAWSGAYRDGSAGALGAGLAAGAGGAAVVGIQNRLDDTIAGLGQTVVQTTTVGDEASYGGRIVLEKVGGARLPYDVRLIVRWNGADHPFVFRVTEDGRDRPPPYPAPSIRPALAPAPAPQPTVTPAALVVAAEDVRTPSPVAPRPAGASARTAPRAPYRNGRDDGVIVPM